MILTGFITTDLKYMRPDLQKPDTTVHFSNSCLLNIYNILLVNLKIVNLEMEVGIK